MEEEDRTRADAEKGEPEEEGLSARQGLVSPHFWIVRPAQEHWFLWAAAAIVSSAAVFWFVVFLPDANVDSARWTLSALVQGTAAVLGTTFVALTFIWNQAERSLDYLRVRRRGYAERLAALGPRVKERLRDGSTHSYAIGKLEHLRRGLVERMKARQLKDNDGVLEQTAYESPVDLLIQVTALCKAIAAIVWRGPQDEAMEKMDRDLLAVGVAQDEIDRDLYWREQGIKSDPFEFFYVVTDIFRIANLAVGETSRDLLSEMSESIDQDDIFGFLSRIRRMRELRGWLFRVTVLVLIASVAWGLIVLSGFTGSTSKAALAGPVSVGLLGTFLTAVMMGRILATE